MIVVLILHVVAGLIGIGGGAMALAARKGSGLHRASGTAFFAAMLIMACGAAILSITVPDRGNLPGAVFTFYLVTTGWTTLREGIVSRRIDYGALAIGAGAAGLAFAVAVAAHVSPTGLVDGKPEPLAGIFGALAAFSVAMDVRRLWFVRPASVQRLRRHVWRMCTALFFATGSFFMGQQQVMPAWLRGSPVLLVLALAPLMVMILWLVRGRRLRTLGAAVVPA